MRCLHCGYDNLTPNTDICPECGIYLPHLMQHLLPPNTKLRQDKYYDIQYAVGKGGFGVTYLATNTFLNTQVAIKEYYPQNCALRNPKTNGMTIPKNQTDAYNKGKEKFKKEATILLSINHPNIVRVLDVFPQNDTVYMVMEYLEGKTLKKLLEEKKLSLPEIHTIFTQIVAALHTIHTQKIYHLDLKPDNIIITPQNQVKLIDFGAAKKEIATIQRNSTRQFTEAYAAPEVLGGSDISAASDIFELGMILHECITGNLPPSALDRAFVSSKYHTWQPDQNNISEPYFTKIKSALLLDQNQRPQDINLWWNNNPIPTPPTPDPTPSKPSFFQKIFSTPVFTPPIPTTPNPSSNLLTYNFESVTVDDTGKIIKKVPRSANYFREDLGKGIYIDMTYIPPGSFTREDGLITIKNPFFIGKYTVTQAQWRIVASYPKINIDLNPDPSYFKGDNLPVENVTWDECQEFCARLSAKTGRKYHLTTEAQWGYACITNIENTDSPFHYGDTITTDLANYDGNYTFKNEPKGIYREKTTPVGIFPPNAFGLYDMHGNVWEGCEDDWSEDYKGCPKDGTALILNNTNQIKLVRGGSWNIGPYFCRSAYRYWRRRDDGYDYLGFRLGCLL